MSNVFFVCFSWFLDGCVHSANWRRVWVAFVCRDLLLLSSNSNAFPVSHLFRFGLAVFVWVPYCRQNVFLTQCVGFWEVCVLLLGFDRKRMLRDGIVSSCSASRIRITPKGLCR